MEFVTILNFAFVTFPVEVLILEFKSNFQVRWVQHCLRRIGQGQSEVLLQFVRCPASPTHFSATVNMGERQGSFWNCHVWCFVCNSSLFSLIRKVWSSLSDS